MISLTKMKNSVFLDSNVYIAGLGSQTGASAEILTLGEKKIFNLIICPLVIEEIERNVKRKLSHALPYLSLALEKLNLKVVKQPARQDRKLSGLFPKHTDRIIFETCQKVLPDYFVSLNRKHFHTNKVKSLAKFKVLTPAEFLAVLRKDT